MNNLKITMLSVLALVFVACDSSEVQMVKGGTLQSCPDKTVEQMVNGYMGNPEWRSLVAEDGNDYVNVVGDISYNNQPTKAEIQFRLNKEKSSFWFQAWELGGNPASNIVAEVLFEKMCYADLEKLAKESVEAFFNMEKIREDLSVALFTLDSIAISEGIEDVLEKCGMQILESIDRKDPKSLFDYKLASCLEKKVKNSNSKNMIQSLKDDLKNKIQLEKENSEVMQKVESLPEKRRKMVEKYAMDDPRMAKQKAKAEASVIGHGFGTFLHMLQAYVVEGNGLGTWRAIGYEPARSSKIAFKEISMPGGDFGEILVSEGIQAINLTDLAGCPARSSWTMLCRPGENYSTKCDCSILSDNKEACAKLTPNFMTLCQ